MQGKLILVFLLCLALAAGAEPAYVQAMRPQVQEVLRKTLAPGAVVLVRSPKGDWTEAFGGLRLDDHFRIGSNTKTMTGTVVLQLVGEGKLGLDDPVLKYRPDVPNAANITIRHLLSMRSGLHNYSETVEMNQILDDRPEYQWNPEHLLKLAFKYPPYFAPGQGYHYSNTNTVLLGRIVERLTGKPIASVFRERIFAPLGLDNTSFPATDDRWLPRPHPRGFQWGSNVGTVQTEVLSPELQAAAANGSLKPRDETYDNPSWGWTAGAGISTADDLARYVEALVGGGLLSDELQQLRLSEFQKAGASSAEYGLALAKLGTYYGHTGELPGFNSFMVHDPKMHTTILTWTNLNAGPDGTPPAVEIGRRIVKALQD